MEEYFPTQDEFYVVGYVYFRVLFTYVFYFSFSKCIFLVTSKNNASLCKVLAVTHIFYCFENPTNSLHPHLITINTYAEDLVISNVP